MGERWILNASPIISLARAGYAELLEQLPERAAIPRAVADEIFAGPDQGPAISFCLVTPLEKARDIAILAQHSTELLAWQSLY